MNYQFKSVDKINGKLLIDAKGLEDGYIFAAIAQPSTKRLKLRIKKNDDIATYDLKNNGQFEMFSLQFGNGHYQVILYENVYNTKYGVIGLIDLNVILKNKNAPFLIPNQYINYHQIPELNSLMMKLCYGKTKNENLKIIKTYIKNNFVYDFVKANTIKKGMLPDIKGLLINKRGICFDIASLAVAMFRIVGIPAKLVIGYADNRYHAWVEIIGSNKSILYDPTQEIYGISKIKNYTPERYY